MPSSQLGQAALGQFQLGQVHSEASGTITLSGIASEEALGSISLVYTQTITLGGIASEEALGAIEVADNTQTLELSGIASEEAFGTLKLNQNFALSGIASEEALGTLRFSIGLALNGIASAESMGGIALVDPDAGFALYINGVERTTYLMIDTLNVTMPLSSNWQGSFTLKDETGTYRPSNGQTFEFWWKGTLMFAGRIQGTRETSPSHTTLVMVGVNCLDWSGKLTRRVGRRKYAYEDGYTTLTLILTDLLASALDNEGFSLGTISTSVSMAAGDEFDFTLKPVQACFNELADFFAVDWKVDQYRVISFQTFAAVAAPFNIADGDGNILADTPIVSRDLNEYRNRQYTRGDVATSVVASEFFTGDGTTKDFTLTRPVSNTSAGDPNPRVFWQGDEYICIRRSEIGSFNPADASVAPFTGPEWFHWDDVNTYTPGSPGVDPARIVSLWTTFTAPAIGDIIEIEFAVAGGAGSNYVESSSEIATRQAIEGGSGIYEAVDDLAAIPPGGSADQIAAGLLNRYGRENVQLEFDTLRSGLYPGMTIGVSLTRPLCSGTMLIESVSASEQQGTMTASSDHRANNENGPFLRFKVQATNSRAVRRGDGGARRFEAINAKLQRVNRKPETFNWALLDTLAVSASPAANQLVAREDGVLREASISFITAPIGASIIVDIKRNGTSIFDATQGKLVFAPTDVGAVFKAVFASPIYKFYRGDIFNIYVDQVGSTSAGAGGTIVLYTQ